MAQQDQERMLFMLAARWADDVRGDKAFDHPAWHYIDYPYKPKGQPASVPAPPPPAENLVQAFQQNVAAVQSGAPDAEKAVAREQRFLRRVGRHVAAAVREFRARAEWDTAALLSGAG